MAVNLIDSNDIQVSQIGNNIELQIDSDIKNAITENTSNIEDAQQDITNLENGNVYSTNEVDTGKVWVDNKPIYRKVIDFGALPSSATTKNVQHNISNLDTFTNVYGIAKDSSNNTLPLPYASTDASSNIRLALNNTNVTIGVGYNLSSYSAYVTLEYTKTN